MRTITIISILLLSIVQLEAKGVDSLVVDSLLNKEKLILQQGAEQGDLMNILFELAKAYANGNQFEQMQETAQRGFAIAKEREEEAWLIAFNYQIGYTYDRMDQYEIALNYYNKTIDAISNGQPVKGYTLDFLTWQTNDRIASVYRNLGKLEKSYEYQLAALDAAEVSRDTNSIGISLYQLGSFFFYQQQYTKALDHYKKAQNCFANSDNKRMIYACYAALGTAYGNLDSLNKSLEYNQKSLAIAKEMNYVLGRAYALNNLGSTYISLKRYDDAYDILTQSLRMKQMSKDKWGQIGSHRSLAEMFIIKNEPEKAIPYLDEAFQIAKDIKSKVRQLEILDQFSVAYKHMDDYKSAMQSMEAYVALKDSVLNEQTVEKLAETKKNFEVKQKEKEILLLQKQNELLEREQEIEQLHKYVWTAVTLFFGTLLLLFGSRYRAQRRSSRLLADKNQEIKKQNGELQKVNDLLSQTNDLLEDNKIKIEEQNKALESSNEDLRNFASVASHDLKEPLRMINSYTSLLNRRYESLFDDRAKEFMGYVVDGCTRMEQMINSLLDYSRVSLEGEKSKFKPVQSKDLIEIVRSNLRYSIAKCGAEIKVMNPDELPVIRADQSQLMQLFQNLVSNAIKFKGDRKPVVELGCRTKGNMHTFYVKDNGIGISESNQQKIFDMLTRLHSKEEYEGTGIGLATVKKIVQRHGGEIWVESEEGQGSTFMFTIPVIRQNIATPV